MECEHKVNYEVHQGVLHLQKCANCGKIREYNPKQKKTLYTTDPDFWGEYTESSALIDKLFQNHS